MQRFSLIITSRNRGEALRELLPALLGLEHPSIEVIVVDNASEDQTREIVQSFPVKYIYYPGGLAEARHLGSMAATGDLISYVDDDCKPGHPKILHQIASAFEANPSAGIIGCRIENIGFSGTQQFKGYTKFGPNALLEFEPNPPAADVFASMTITIRRDLYHRIGGFDPAFSKGCEEVDLCMKVKSAGFSLVYIPEPFYFHHQMGSHFRFNPIHNRDFMRLYSFFKFFPPSGFAAWKTFIRNEWRLFLHDAAQIKHQYSQPDFTSTHLPSVNRALQRFPVLRKLLRWPLMLGAIVVSPLLRRAFIPLIYWQAKQRKRFEQIHYGLSYA